MREHIILGITTQESAKSWFTNFVQKVESLPSACKIYDKQGRFVAGSSVEYENRKPFIKTQLGIDYLSGWQVELYIDDAAYELAAKRQAAIYRWTGILVVLLILISGVIATQAVSKQIKLNRLKNDFIATVTHELKTPLASMRVLVDTLLEGRYKDQSQVDEYLGFVAKENARLSRLIDNFLTFSRMERNKHSFDMLPVLPGDIAGEAAEVVKTKFKQNNCQLRVEIAEELPEITADPDAMVTVLVNLLDNACKYGRDDDKQVELKAFKRDSAVCFEVTDNGIGMSRRTVRKVFGRFYQADRTLTRQTEGCGLGLSIVKFIVDAHKGTIDVASKIGKGSVFTVKLP